MEQLHTEEALALMARELHSQGLSETDDPEVFRNILTELCMEHYFSGRPDIHYMNTYKIMKKTKVRLRMYSPSQRKNKRRKEPTVLGLSLASLLYDNIKKEHPFLRIENKEQAWAVRIQTVVDRVGEEKFRAVINWAFSGTCWWRNKISGGVFFCNNFDKMLIQYEKANPPLRMVKKALLADGRVLDLAPGADSHPGAVKIFEVAC